MVNSDQFGIVQSYTLTPAARSSLSTLGDVHAFVTLLMTITQKCIVYVRGSLVGRGLTQSSVCLFIVVFESLSFE